MSSINYYSKLSEEEFSNPWLVVHAFFDHSGIESVKENMWDWLKVTVSGTFCTKMLDRDRRYDMLYLYEHLEKLIEAIHLIYAQQPRYKKPVVHEEEQKAELRD